MINFSALYPTARPLPVVPPGYYAIGGSNICELNCWLSSQCANHDSAGDFRTEDGMTPDMIKVDGNYYCAKTEDHESQTIGMIYWDEDNKPRVYTGPYNDV